MDLAKFIKNCSKGDKKDIKTLYLEYGSIIKTVCFRYIKDKNKATDVFHDCFVKLLSSLDKYSFEGSFEGWIRRMAVNYCLDLLRKKEPLTFVEELTDHGEEIEETEDSELEKVLNTDISKDDWQDLIFKLPEHFRVVFCLFFIDNYSHQEIAKTLNIALKTSRSRLYRAKVLLKGFIKEYVALSQNG